MVDGVSRQGFNGVLPSLVRCGKAVDSARAEEAGQIGIAKIAQVSVSRVEAGLPPVDTARVSAIRAELAAGTYRVEAGRIADAMMADLAGK